MQVFNNKENIGDLTKLSVTSVRLAPSVMTVGGQQFSTGILDCDLTTDIDTGSVAANTFYYLYAVVSAGSVILKFSLSKVSPLGYTAYKRIGAFTTDGSSQVLDQAVGLEFKKFQTKKFTGINYNTTGAIPELTFNNLDISKLYSFFGKVQLDHTTTSSTDKYSYINVTSVDGVLGNSNIRYGADTTAWMCNTWNIPKTKMSLTTLEVYITAILNMQTQYGYATMTEITDNYDASIETNEW